MVEVSASKNWSPSDETRLHDFSCPDYLMSRIKKKGILDDDERIIGAFEEWKKYVNLCMSNRSKRIPMVSKLIDEMWHHFILFTREYHDFSSDILGIQYFHHAPTTKEHDSSQDKIEFFIDAYTEKYGEIPADYWGSVDEIYCCKTCNFDCSGRCSEGCAPTSDCGSK